MISIALVIPIIAAAQVELRSAQPAPACRILRVDSAGILLAPAVQSADPAAAPPGAPAAATPALAIGWDRILRIDGEFAEAAAPFRTTAENAWRARTRLERADALAAEPLFEQLFTDMKAASALTGATGAVVAEGLLRCRLRRGAHMAAIEPWLTLLQSRTGIPALGADWALQAGLPPVVDEATGLAPALPPMWLPWPAVEGFARSASIDSTPREGPITARAEAMAALYLHAARFELGLPTMLPIVRSPDSGVQFALAIVQARSGDSEQRQRARQRLEERLRPPPPTPTANAPDTPIWIEAWCRAAIGRSLLMESSPDLKRQGVLELLHLPARYATSHPYLSGLALAEASAALRALGDPVSADILTRELVQNYPTHPVLDWEHLRRQAHPQSSPARSAGTPPTRPPQPD
jgi:hypothetical protein